MIVSPLPSVGVYVPMTLGAVFAASLSVIEPSPTFTIISLPLFTVVYVPEVIRKASSRSKP